MKKFGIILLLLIYAFIQLIVVGWDIYKPAIHTVCYNIVRLYTNEKSTNNLTITTDKTSYQNALQDENEILWQGELYDVKNVLLEGNTVTLTVERDYIETNWVKVYNNIQQKIKKDSFNHSSTNLAYYKWLFKLYIPCEPINTGVIADVASIKKYQCSFNYFPVFYSDISSPPPDLFS